MSCPSGTPAAGGAAGRPTFDGSGTGGDASPHIGTWNGAYGTGTVAGGSGTGGDVKFGAGGAPNADFKMSGKGGSAVSNAGGGAQGGNGKGGSFTFA